ncbi:hypothetical protein BN970_05078 [Mycolicibacterium conceptionense]|uniref:Uncharacterized protein n=1 Tax=Mycolicibacterium conceptionense TaxID=451644 RepID=A0A0U1DRU4_9MYCO|nr:hypothetical protein BN970_05078 [Mycolicibacterium conceptionense]
MSGHVQWERGEGQQGEEAEVVEQRGDRDAEQATVAQRPERIGQGGGAFGPRRGRQQECGDHQAKAIRAETPKKGPRQEIEPRTPPTSGPIAIPRPSAAS